MTIQYSCTECGASMSIKEKLAGTKGKCPKCQTEFTVPVTEDSIEQFLAGDSGDPVASKPAFASNAADEEFGQARMGTDPSAPEDESDDESNPSVQTASQTADALVSIAKADRKSKRAERKMAQQAAAAGKPVEAAKKAPRSSGDDIDWAETAKVLTMQFLPATVLIGVVTGGIFWLSSQLFSGVDRPELASVSGIVTLDGEPLANAIITFQPDFGGMESGTKIGNSVGKTDARGRYTLEYSKDAKGAALGKHKVEIIDSEGLLPAEYHRLTTLQAEVTAGSNKIDFPLKSTLGP